MPEIDKTNIDAIIIKGARVHNLKNIDITIPRNKYIVITGLSGSGKSSLAFDTIYAEGQRRYVESLSAYARQFLGRIHKPEVDFIHGIPPAIAIEQKVNTRNPRSTVGTSTEIYDYLKLLFARIGKTISPVSGKEVVKHTVKDVVDHIFEFEEGTVLFLYVIFNINQKIDPLIYLKDIQKQGFTRVIINKEVKRIEDVIENPALLQNVDEIGTIIDRIMVGKDEDSKNRYADSAQLAFDEGEGECFLALQDDLENPEHLSVKFEMDGISFEEPSVHMFSFNNPLGACPRCEGYGKILGIDPDLVVPNKSLSIYEDAIVCWKGEKMGAWRDELIYSADKFDFPIHKPFFELSAEQKQLLWSGNRYFKGLNSFFDFLDENKYKIQYRVMMSRYRGKTMCTECGGKRLKKEASYIKVHGYVVPELVELPVEELDEIFRKLTLGEYEQKVAGRILVELKNRLEYLVNVGLGYLTLNRLSSTLSGGESQRINLATSLGSSLVGSLYVLDEPSIGLHSRDTHLLIRVLKKLQSLGNTLLVVEHDEEIIRSADEIIDIGPEAGRHGGEVVFQGKHDKLVKQKNSLTADYLTGKKCIRIPDSRRKWNNSIHVHGARENNLKNISVRFPLNTLTVVTGVSGSGKSTLVKNILYGGLNKLIGGYGERTGEHDSITGDIKRIKHVEFVDQNPIGRSSRSNPVTYIKAYDEIRKLFSRQALAGHYDFKPSHFSFNTEGGRCEECQGEGIIKVEMQFMADVQLICESCHGKRFKDEVLEVKYKGANIFDVLEFTINQSLEFFGEGKSSLEKKIVEKIKPLADVGLGYVKLGQSSSTLSGGESQRVKLASFLGKEKDHESTLFIFDEPTTGLHFHDINTLLKAFEALIKVGHSIVIIEHNLEIIKSADWIIDLGPEGGKYGGEVIFEGTPEDLIKSEKSYTANYLKEKLQKGR